MDEITNQLLQAALGYAALGLPVFPCIPGTKRPATEHGFKDATTDEATIRRWWTENPCAGIGMPTGSPSGLIVLDVDPRNGGDAGVEYLTNKHGALPCTAEGLTGGGGRHLFFLHPGTAVRCSQGEVAPGVDVKGDGGYVVLPPTVHPNGTLYAWEASAELGEVAPAPCPAWLITAAPSEVEVAGDPDDGNPIPSGHRNATLARLAGGMRRFGMTRKELDTALQAINAGRCVPPLPITEVAAIAASIARYEPDAVSVAIAEDHYGQTLRVVPRSARTGPQDPGPMPLELLRVPGFMNEVIDWCLQNAPYPNPHLAFAGALALQAFLGGRKVRDPGDNRTNLYILGLAQPGAGKDWPRKANIRILSAIGMADAIGDRFASGEGVQDALLATPSMLFLTDEIDGMLLSINKSRDARHESIMGILLTLFSSSNAVYPLRRKAGQEKAGSVNQPCLVLMGTAIPTYYYAALSERMLTNGFVARCIIVECPKRGAGREPGNEDVPPQVLAVAKWWKDFCPGTGNLSAENPTPRIVPHTEEATHMLVEAREMVDREYAVTEDNQDPVGTTIWSRVSEHIRKLSLIYAISENHLNPVIGEAAVRWATAFALHQARRLLFMAASHSSESEFDATAKKLLEKLRAAPNHQLPHSVILKRSKLDAKQFGELIETLLQRGDIELSTTATEGRPHRAYRLVDSDVGNEGSET